MGSHNHQFVSLGHLQRGRLRRGTKLFLFPFQSLPFDVWSLLGAWTLRLFRICHVPLTCKLQEKAIYGLISHANTSNKSDICSGDPSNRLCKAPSRVSRSLGSLILSPGKSFCSQGTIKSLLAFFVCTEHTMPPILRD